MMMTQMIVAVALGLTPVSHDTQPIAYDAAIAAKVGAFTQTADSRGAIHIRGTDARGQAYALVMDRNGYVEAEIGDRVVNFHVAEHS